MDMRKLFMVMVGCLAITGICSADLIGDTDGVTVTATAGSTFDANVPPSTLIDGSGMTPNDPVIMASTTDNHISGWGMWLSGYEPTGNKWLQFTFSSSVSISDMVIWNFNQNWDNAGYNNLWHRGLKDVVITYSTGADESGLGNTFFAGQLACATGSATQAYTDMLAAPNGLIDDVKAVRITYTTNYNEAGDLYSDGYYGLSEVRFVSAVPEPATMVLLALGGVAGLIRRRK